MLRFFSSSYSVYFVIVISRSKHFDKSVIQKIVEILNKLTEIFFYYPSNYYTFKRNLNDFLNSLLQTMKLIVLVKCHGVTSNFRDFFKTITNKINFGFVPICNLKV